LFRESLEWEDKIWIAEQLIESFIKLHALRAFHGDFGSGKVFLTSENRVKIGDFAPIKPFSLQSKQQSPIEFYQIWFDEGLDGEANEIGKGCYLAPERLKFNPIESFEAADLFSLGCVLMELFSSCTFLQFKDTLKLSNSKDKEEYDEILTGNICNIFRVPIDNLIKRLCSFDPMERSLTLKDLEMIKSLADSKLRNWRNSIENYKTSESFYSKKLAISQFPNEIQELESLILLILKEKDEILKGLLFKYLLDHNKSEEQNSLFEEGSLKVFNINNTSCDLNLIKALKSGNREVIYQQISMIKDLKDVIFALETMKLPEEKLKGILNKSLQIYRSRDLKDVDFEDLLIFEYLNLKAEANVEIDEEISNLYKTFNRNQRDLLIPASLSRIAFQLDLKKNKVPIEEAEDDGEKDKDKDKDKDKEKKVKRETTSPFKMYPRLKQRLLMKLRINENIIGVLQSPDKNVLICYSQETLIFWDFKALLLRGLANEPIATVNPRSEAVITSIIYGDDPETILISFKDGIIGLYK
jgi:hypothetical protein